MANPASLKEVRSDLQELFAKVEVDAIPSHDGDEATLWVTARQEPSLLFRGESLDIFRSVQGRLAASALARGGPSRKAIERHLIEACTVSATSGEAAALALLEDRLRQPPGRWIVAEGIDAHVPQDDLSLGACRFYRSLPDWLVGEHILMSARERLKGPVVLVEVEAHDENSARLIAHDRFAEARSILTLGGQRGGSLPANLVIHPTDRVTVTAGPGPLIAPSLWDSEGRVHPTLRGLSDAAARAEDQRSDWERRAIAAARWWTKAARSVWPSEALTSAMTALECLLVEGRGVANKGEEIAKRASERWVFKRHTRDEQEQWLRALYRARNQAVHEGRQYVEDLEVDRLIDLTAQAATWGAWHLSDYHSESGKPCESFGEVMSHDLRPLAWQ
jgi:hypothetical protein